MTDTTIFDLGVVINLDRSPARMENFLQANENHFHEIIRVSAVDKNDLDLSDVHAFRDAALETAGRYPELKMTPRKRDDYWAGSCAVYQSHLAAIDTGVMLGDRFMVLEDDAAIRADLLESTEEPILPGVQVWGGALRGGSYTDHHRRYAAWQDAGLLEVPEDNPWTPLDRANRIRDRYQATAYQMTAEEGARWAAIVRANPQAYDSAWWTAMLEIQTWVPRIEVIPQQLDLGSDRSSATHHAHLRNAKKV